MAYGELWPYYTQRIPYYGDPICPHCGKQPDRVASYLKWITTNNTASSPQISTKHVDRAMFHERFAVEQGDSTESAMRAEEV